MKLTQTPDLLHPTYELFVDGSPGPKVKPGHSGWGLVLMAGSDPVFQACGTTQERCTSQAIELEAVIQGLAYIHRSFSGYITLWSDSKYTADSISKLPGYAESGWLGPKGKALANGERLQLLWDYLCNLELLSRVTIRWDKGHNKNIGNDLADFWSKEASGKGLNWYGGADQAG